MTDLAPRIRHARTDLARIEAHGYAELAASLRNVLERVIGWHGKGYPQTGGTGSRGGTGADPTGSAAAEHDPIASWVDAQCTAIRDIARGLNRARAVAGWSQPLGHHADGRRGVTCKGCTRPIVCTPEDPVHPNGLCTECHRLADAQRKRHARHARKAVPA